MSNTTQLERYKKLISFIDKNFKEPINIEKIESISHYSYRNINRIFLALHNETIGKYIKRIRLEKGAQYLKYSDAPISDIAYEIGFEDRASFSKAFKKKYHCSPLVFRTNNELHNKNIQELSFLKENTKREKLQYEIEYLPDFEYIFLEYRGNYEDFSAVDNTWNQLENYVFKKGLLSDTSIFMTEIIDDEDISDHINTRYNTACILEQSLKFVPEGLFRTNTHRRQKYAKFIHKGSYNSCIEYYNKIYAFWMLDVMLELEDRSTLEFYPNITSNISVNDILTEIYIPVK